MESSESSESPAESPIDLPSPPSRSPHSSISDQTRSATRVRRSKDGSSMRDVARVLIARERETTADLKRAMHTLSEQLKAERQRADAAEAKTREVLGLFKNANKAKIAAEQDAARANEGLRLYKLQYENAQEEIRRAQKLIDSLEAQRVDAEEAAAKARSTARKLKEEKIVMQAREEGRRQGIQEGMAQGRVMGYEEGRTAGYEHGRAAAEREFTSAPVTEMEYETPRAREYMPPRVSRPSTSEDSPPPPVIPDYTQPMDNTESIPPPLTTPARIPTPSETMEQPVQEPVPIHPISIRNSMFSPSHPAVDVPPDGWIPSLDEDNRIRLPPPHEMAPPPPKSPEPLSAVLNNVKNIPSEPVMIPPPSNPAGDPSNRKVKHRRRNSTDSHSTTMSQFEILGPPTPAGTMPRGATRDRANVLSAIAEERERTSSASSPVYDMSNLSTQSFTMPIPSPNMPVPSPQPTPVVPPQNPTYPDTTPRYARSAENLARSGGDYYRADTPGYGSEASYRSGTYGSRSQEQLRDREQREREQRERKMEHVRLQHERERVEQERENAERARQRVERERAALERERAALDRERKEREHTERERMNRERAERERVDRERIERERERERERARSTSAYGGSRYGDHTPRREPSVPNIYAPPHSPHSSPDTPSSRTPAIVAPAPSLRRPPPTNAAENRGSMSSNEISFTVVPPSRPESNVSVAQTEGVFLSAEDADRALPSVPETPAETAPVPSSPVIPPQTQMMLGGPWPPPGFVPTGPTSPSMSSAGGPAGVPLPPSSYGGSTIGPAGVPLPPSVYGGTPSVRSEAVIPGGFSSSADPPPVIPLQPSSRSSGSAGSSRKVTEPYSRANIKRRDEDSESSVSSGLGSADSLTTPPTRPRKLSKPGRSTPAYAAAPIPAGIQYPVPPTPRSSTSNSLGSHTNRAARVPLPPSVSGSIVGSAVGGPTRPGSAVGGPPPRSGSVVSGTRPPSIIGMDRPRSPMMGARSPMMGGARNLMSPNMMSSGLPVLETVIPIPIPEPSPITQPVQILASPRRMNTPLADIEPSLIIPSVARVPSPVASSVSAAPTNFTTTTKGGKKGKKKR